MYAAGTLSGAIEYGRGNKASINAGIPLPTFRAPGIYLFPQRLDLCQRQQGTAKKNAVRSRLQFCGCACTMLFRICAWNANSVVRRES